MTPVASVRVQVVVSCTDCAAIMHIDGSQSTAVTACLHHTSYIIAHAHKTAAGPAAQSPLAMRGEVNIAIAM